MLTGMGFRQAMCAAEAGLTLPTAEVAEVEFLLTGFRAAPRLTLGLLIGIDFLVQVKE